MCVRPYLNVSKLYNTGKHTSTFTLKKLKLTMLICRVVDIGNTKTSLSTFFTKRLLICPPFIGLEQRHGLASKWLKPLQSKLPTYYN